ncbi:Com family DNA-binding transcriptional regulator [Psychrobacter sp. I-STPA10]|uniref:Com family DNA-binding transcriptional regulator n=1 Tax=Psychrobacter sp. I-STPA10 TaxID=2585769 RepID=UPI001E47161C|nr:Com family DNA-binding transcriptional regulator [Psychrobacter sp. I-STPA10]
MKFIKCQNCGKKLLKIGVFDNLSIKCSRCKIINTMSVKHAANPSTIEAHEALIQKGQPRGNLPAQTLQQSSSAIRRSET